jgi:hypothetical protein
MLFEYNVIVIGYSTFVVCSTGRDCPVALAHKDNVGFGVDFNLSSFSFPADIYQTFLLDIGSCVRRQR